MRDNDTMRDDARTIDELLRENEELRGRLEEAEATIHAIRSGQVDAFVVTRAEGGDEVFTLKTADRPYRLFVQSMREGAVTLDGDGTILFCNEYFAELLKTPPERLVGATLREFVPDEDRAEYDALLAAGRGEIALRRTDGAVVPVGLAVHPLVEDAPTVTFCVLVTDLTEQRHYQELKRTQAALRESEQRLRFTLHATQVGQWDLNLVTGTVERTPRHDQIFGYDSLLPEWSYDTFLNKHVHPDDRAETDRTFQEALATGKEWKCECRIVRADQALRWVWVSGAVYTTKENQPLRMTGLVMDVTERKQLEDDLRRTAAELSEASRRKDEFLATLAHELRNPLAPIRSGLELIRMAGDDRALVEEVRATMEEQTRQLVRLVDDLLDVSRITSGKITLRKERVELASAMRNAVDAARPLIEEAGHELIVALPPRPIFLEADPARLAQILSNLLTNAARYTPDGGRIWLSARVGCAEHTTTDGVLRGPADREHQTTFARRVEPAGETRQNASARSTHPTESPFVQISIKDTGIGIPAEMLESIFEMMTQGDRSLERSQSGLGIGLTLVKRLAEMHGGSVEAWSEGPDKGSEFVVRLPVLTEQTQESRILDEENSSRAGQLRVLVVDDNQAAAKMLGMVLKALGHEPHTAHDGLEALDAAARLRPDLVLMDIGMPRLNGHEAARRMREQPWGENLVLVALTGWGQEEDKQRTKEAGFNHHLVKPVEPEALRKLLDDHPPRGGI
jgi:two-component system CheB/CheR fusion protein